MNTAEIEELAAQLLWEGARYHQEYGYNQYLVLKYDMEKLQELARRSGEEFKSQLEGMKELGKI